MNYQKNQELTLTITDMTREGEGLGKDQGFPFFIKDTVIGDVVRASITKCKKNYGYARLLQVVTPSRNRVRPRCPVARQCGGCKVQQLDYEAQKEYKWNLVASSLKRIGGFREIESKMEPILAMEEPWHYRNKAQFPIGRDKSGKLVAGFYAGRTHAIIPNTDCHIQAAVTQPILEKILTWMEEYGIEPYDEKTHTGLVRHVLTRVGFTTGEIMVCLVVNGTAADLCQQKNHSKDRDRKAHGTHQDYGRSEKASQEALQQLIADLTPIAGMKSIIVNTNKENTNRILGAQCETVWGQDYIEDYIGNVRYQIGPLSFYQVNPAQTSVLYRKALEYADLHGEEDVWDLYCGIGTISLFLAQKARKVYGVEIVPEAIDDARNNARINGIDNAEFFVGKAEEVVPREYEKQGIRPDVIVVDPPRKGCDRTLMDTMLAMAPERIVYVSCDPATLARDCKILCEADYEIVKAVPVDQFPHTTHVETVVLMSRKDS